MAGRVLAGAALCGAAVVSAQRSRGQCDTSNACTFTTQDKAGKSVNFDFRGLCNPTQDYVLDDGAANGHVYYANICGTTQKNCLPQGWNNQYEYGSVTQTWGTVPACDLTNPDMSCEDENGNAVCCTESCQVIAVQSPVFTLLSPGDPYAGVQLSYLGEQPTVNDPYTCDTNPSTNQPYPRTTRLQFFCDPDAAGYAKLYEVDQNATDDCDYVLKFKTNLVCGTQVLSGGWIFMIVLIVCSTVYAGAGYGWSWYKSKTLAHPHAAYFSAFYGLVFDGVMFIASGFKKPSTRYSGLSGSSAATSLGASEGAAAVPAFTGSSDSSAASGSGYQGFGAA